MLQKNIKAIFYKEWIKTRWYMLLAFLISFGFAGYAMLRLNRVATLKGLDHMWVVMISRDAIFVDLLTYVPLIIGIVFAFVQFIPEMQRKCLKLTLHLPCKQLFMINSMLAYGLLSLVICFGVSYLLMFSYLQSILAVELYSRILLTTLPWYIAGIAAYFLVAWICLEPTWRRRIINTIIAVLLLKIFFLSPEPEAYNSFIPCLTIYTILTISLSWLSVSRFKEGKQD